MVIPLGPRIPGFGGLGFRGFGGLGFRGSGVWASGFYSGPESSRPSVPMARNPLSPKSGGSSAESWIP